MTALQEDIAALRRTADRPQPGPGPGGATLSHSTGRPGSAAPWPSAVAMTEPLRQALQAAGPALPYLYDGAAWRRLYEATSTARQLAADAASGRLRFPSADEAAHAWRDIWARLCELAGDLATTAMARLRPGGRSWRAARQVCHAAAESTARARRWLPPGERLTLGSYEPPVGTKVRTRFAADAATQLHDKDAGPLSDISFPGPLDGMTRRAPAGRRARARAARTALQRARTTASPVSHP